MENDLEGLEQRILSIIFKDWPCHPAEIVRKLGLIPSPRNLARVRKCVEQLIRERKVRAKRLGRLLVLWPAELEKLESLYEVMKRL